MEDIAHSFEIVSVSRSEIKLKFKFKNPLKISPQDKLLVDMDFSKFEEGVEEDYVF